jgi:hypothetical protein
LGENNVNIEMISQGTLLLSFRASGMKPMLMSFRSK